MKLLEDHEGNTSSFRLVWAISVLLIVGSWAWVGISTGALQPWPMDGVTTIGLIMGPAAKTFAERK